MPGRSWRGSGLSRGRLPRGPQRRPCNHFFTHGRCKFGSHCKFSHDPSDNGRGPPTPLTQSPEESHSYYTWRRLIKTCTLESSGRMIWVAALEILDGDNREFQQMVAKELVSDDTKGLTAVLSALNVEDLESESRLLFACDFLKVITHPALLDCLSIDPYVGTLYCFIAGTNGDRAIKYVTKLCRWLQRIHNQATQARQRSMDTDEIVTVILKVLYELLRRERRMLFNDELPTLFSTLDSAIGTMPSPNISRNRIEAMKQMVKSATGLLATPTVLETTVAGGSAAASTFPFEALVPGDRHDNDHADISRIKVFPTLGEITSDQSDYLPSTNFLRPHFLKNHVQRYIDSAFRLLRHDTFGPLKDELNAMLHGMREGTPHHQLLRNSQMRAYLYTRASIRHIAVDERRGLEAHVSFEPPPQLRDKPKVEQQRWWQESPCLAEGGLVCFAATRGGEKHILFMIVAEKNAAREHTKNQSHLASGDHPPSITLKLAATNEEDFRVLRRMYLEKAQGVLVDVPSLIPATFVHILQNLQEMMRVGEVPFRRWIVPSEAPARKNHGVGEATNIPPPAYACQPGFVFHLDCIAVDGRGRLTINPTAPEATDLNALVDRTGLDPGQCQGLIAALTREYALIQGPPGTGKSYVGVKMVQVLLAHKKSARLGPIIVICYTNPALDQFLKHLLDIGIERIIRIGGQSRTPELEGKNLRDVSRETSRTRLEGQVLGKSYSELETALKRAGYCLKSLHKGRSAPTSALLQDFLQRRYHEIHDRFFLQTMDEDGFEVAGGKDPVGLWLKGKTIDPRGVKDAGQADEADLDALIRRAKANIHSLSKSERQTLASHWMYQLCEEDEDGNLLFYHTDQAEKLRRDINDVHDEVNRRTLLAADVIGVTTTGLARNVGMLRRARSKIIICEEAGEVMEPHIISALMPGLEHLVQIGDHRQLRPQIQNWSGLSLESPIGRQYQLDRSQFERRATGEPGMRAAPVAQLNIQRRMRPEISRLIRRIYPALQDHESVKNLPAVVGMRENVFWLDHNHMEDTSGYQHRAKFHSNEWEVGMTKALVRHFVRQGVYKADDIAVLTPYTDQLQKLRSYLNKDYEISLSDRDQDALAADGFAEESAEAEVKDTHKPLQKKTLAESLRLATVDNFQGEEAKIIIVSLVRANEKRNVGFLRTENRINVLVSRAQHGMFLIGNVETYLSVDMWSQIHAQLTEVDAVGHAVPLCCPRHPDKAIMCSEPDDFLLYAPEGGCDLPCEKRLEACGHRCQAKCHSKAMHDVFSCPQPCPRIRPTCSHACSKLCGKECGRCMVKMKDVVLPCGHAKDLSCHQTQDLSAVYCTSQVDKRVPGCQHAVVTECGRDVSSKFFHCPTPCEQTLSCGHPCRGTCDVCRRVADDGVIKIKHQVCQKKCDRPYGTCSHRCPKRCHAGEDCGNCEVRCQVKCPHSACTSKCSEPCAPCIEPCSWSCPHLGSCTMPCAAPCNRLPCDKRCERTLRCGHQCPGICGEDCAEGHCQVCYRSKQDARVDLLEFKTYREIDLAETPIVVLGCGHFFTAESLDGHVGMSEAYTTDRSGQPSGLKDMAGAMANGVPSCPDCKCPIRQFATKRYNRVINRAVMDEASKRFLVSGRARLGALEGDLKQVEEHLDATRDDVFRTVALSSQPVDRLQRLRERHKDAIAIEKGAVALRKIMDQQNQPAKKLFDAILTRRNAMSLEDQLETLDVSCSQSENHPHKPVFDKQVSLGARLIQLKAQEVMLRDKFTVTRSKKSVAGTLVAPHGSPGKPVPIFMKDCLAFIDETKVQKLPRLAIQASICYARISAWSSSFDRSPSTNEPSTKKTEKKGTAQYGDTTRELLGQALELCDQLQAAEELRAVVQATQKLFAGPRYESVTPEELAAVKIAMVSGARGINTHSGHWYNCVNGHPFAIGECGMAMEQASCPECGSPIGGQNHQMLEGVTRATEMER